MAVKTAAEGAGISQQTVKSAGGYSVRFCKSMRNRQMERSFSDGMAVADSVDGKLCMPSLPIRVRAGDW